MNQKSVVFISLLIDLFAFALILPLFPKIFEYYASNENDNTYSLLEYFINKFRTIIMVSENKNFNLVLFGGAIGSLFSLLQFFSSTIAGAISDIYGRKKILLLVMFGTLLSYIIWSFSSFFIIFLLSRIVGGVTKANVSLSIAIMTDLSNVDNRSSAMALVGIAFSLGFIMGPTAGAMFSKFFVDSSVFVYPAYLAILVTSINILFVAVFYKESLPIEKRAKSIKNNISEALQLVNPVSLFKFSPVKSVKNHELKVLQSIGYANFIYLFLYSGLEFTLTFLVHDRFKYDSAQQGKMFLFIGIIMTLVQGGYVRRLKEGKHIKAAISAIFLLIPGFVIIALAMDQIVFYVGLALYCFSSAVVVQCFTTIISNYGNEDEKGKVTGVGRSIGSLARAFGPIFASMLYWAFGPTFAYIFGGSALVVPLCILIKLERKKIKSN